MPQVPNNTAKQFRTVHPNMAGVLSINPRNVRFQTQNRGEKVFIKARAHPLINIDWVFNSAFLAIFPILVAVGFYYLPFDINILDYVEWYYLALVLIIYYSVLYTSVLYSFMDWYYDVYLVTNERILNFQFEPLKRHRIAEARLENIENVSESVIGFLPSINNYGDVKIQTAAHHNLFTFRAVPDPSWFRDVVVDLSRLVKKSYHRRRGGRDE